MTTMFYDPHSNATQVNWYPLDSLSATNISMVIGFSNDYKGTAFFHIKMETITVISRYLCAASTFTNSLTLLITCMHLNTSKTDITHQIYKKTINKKATWQSLVQPITDSIVSIVQMSLERLFSEMTCHVLSIMETAHST